MSRIKAVIFDLGRVLINVDSTRGIFALLNSSLKHATTESVIRMLWDDDLYKHYNAGRISPREFHESFCRKFELNLTFDRFAKIWCDVFSPMPGMEQLLRRLHGTIALGLLSDTDPLHWQYLFREYPMLGLIKKPTLSFETGFLKPSPQSFLAAAQNVGVPAENCLYIDDLKENIEGARRVAMEAIHFSGAEPLQCELFRRGLLLNP
jgi:HAD superfamily hydrolase (TIGR01509 family)